MQNTTLVEPVGGLAVAGKLVLFGLPISGLSVVGRPVFAPLAAITIDPPILTPVIHTTDRYAAVQTSGGEVFAGSLGWRFTLQRKAVVTALGFFDYSSNGLGNAHTVSVHRVSSSALVASVVVPAGTQATLLGGYRFTDLTSPVALDSGEYVVWSSSFTSTDPYVRVQTTRDDANGAITFGSRYYSAGSGIPASAPDPSPYFPVSIRLWTGKALSLTGNIPSALNVAQEIAIYRKVGSSLTKLGTATVSQLSWQYSDSAEQTTGSQTLRVAIQALGATQPAANDAYADVVYTVD